MAADNMEEEMPEDEEAPPIPESQSASANKETMEDTISLSELAEHDSEDDCWIGYNGQVYDITEFLGKHKAPLTDYCGTDKSFEDAFTGKHGTSKIDVLESEGVLQGSLG